MGFETDIGYGTFQKDMIKKKIRKQLYLKHEKLASINPWKIAWR